MAGKDIYFGKLLELLISSLEALGPELTEATADQTTALTDATMAQTTALNNNLSQMVTKLTQNVTELQAVKTAISQVANSVKLKPSDTVITALAHNAIAKNSGTTYTASGFRFKGFSDGAIRLKLNAYYAGNPIQLGWSLDNGATIYDAVAINSTTPAEYSFDLPVSMGAIVSLFFKSTAGTTTLYIQANSIRMCGTHVDIINDNQFIQV